jgi:hypothetical protein
MKQGARRRTRSNNKEELTKSTQWHSYEEEELRDDLHGDEK